MNEELVTEIYQQLCIDSDENLLASALADKYDSGKFDAAFKKAYERFLKQTAPGYPAKYRQALASYALIAARSFHVCDYKTAKSAIDSKVKLLEKLESKDNFNTPKKPEKGRKSTFSKALAEEICALIKHNGWSLHKAALKAGAARTSVFRWRDQRPDFREQILRAREAYPDHLRDKAHNLLEELEENSQKAATPDEKSRCLDSYRRFLEFMLSKHCPEYKDKQTLEMTGANGTPLHQASPEQMQDLAERIAAARNSIEAQAREKERPND